MGGEGEGKAGGKTFQGGGPRLLVVSGQGMRLTIAKDLPASLVKQFLAASG